jgi:hypothetical protein
MFEIPSRPKGITFGVNDVLERYNFEAAAVAFYSV